MRLNRACPPDFVCRAASAAALGFSSAGSIPNNAAHSKETTTVNKTIRRSSRAAARNGTPVGATAMKTRSRISASTHPAAAPAIASMTASVSVWRISLPRLAPSADRTASSRSRAAPRAENRLATLAQAISSTANTAPSNTHAALYASAICRSRIERTCK